MKVPINLFLDSVRSDECIDLIKLYVGCARVTFWSSKMFPSSTLWLDFSSKLDIVSLGSQDSKLKFFSYF